MIRTLLAFLIVTIGVALAAPVGPVPFGALPNCPSGGLGYTAATGAFACNSFGAGSGNVTGPGSSTAGHFAIFDGTSGQLLKDTLAAPGTAATVNTGTSGATIPLLNGTNVWSAQQSGSITTLSISTATFTPDGTNNDYSITLVHASCPCTLANPSATPVAGTHGVIYVIQSSTGSDTIGTYGSQYLSAGGTSTITLSTGANAIDVFSYAVKDSTHIVLSPILNVSH